MRFHSFRKIQTYIKRVRVQTSGAWGERAVGGFQDRSLRAAGYKDDRNEHKDRFLNVLTLQMGLGFKSPRPLP